MGSSKIRAVRTEIVRLLAQTAGTCWRGSRAHIDNDNRKHVKGTVEDAEADAVVVVVGADTTAGVADMEDTSSELPTP